MGDGDATGGERGKRDRIGPLAERIADAFGPLDDSHFRKSPGVVRRDRHEIAKRYCELERTLDYESAARQARLEWLLRVLGEWDRAGGEVASAGPDRPRDAGDVGRDQR